MQRLLIKHGAAITADGDFGPATKRALEDFQTRAGLTADGVAGPRTLATLRAEPSQLKPSKAEVNWSAFVDLFPQVTPQVYLLKAAQTPTQPKGVRLSPSLIGNLTINCTQFTTWIVSQAYGTRWTSDRWARWQNTGRQVHTGAVPDYGPRVALEWGIGSTSPGPGPWLVQYFTRTGGHSLLVVDWDQDTDKILTLEANSFYGLDGVGWANIGNLRDVPNPGACWANKVTQTWASRIQSKHMIHVTRLHVTPGSVRGWLNSGEK